MGLSRILPLGISVTATLTLVSSAQTAGAAVPWRYDVTVSADHSELAITADFGAVNPGELAVMQRAAPFVAHVEADGAGGRHAVKARSGRWRTEACTAAGCRLHYVFLLANAARELNDPEIVGDRFGVVQTNPSAWLLHPDTGDASQPVELTVHPAAGAAFATGLFPAAAPDTYRTTADHLYSLPLALFGPLRRYPLKASDGTAEIVLAPTKFPVSDGVLQAWAERAVKAVVAYYGRYPVPHALVYIQPRFPGGGGVTFGYGGATIMIPVAPDATAASLKNDWVLTHEMVHLAFPSLPRRHHWLEEGQATYIEPLARIRSGELKAEDVFLDMVKGLPQGLPQAGDKGLDGTRSWGRTYWGGALFCLLADIEIRRQSGGRIGLETALRGVLDAGGSVAEDWGMDRALAAADKATGLHVLADLYGKMRNAPYPVDLPALWAKLGVVVKSGKVTFDDRAELAYVRQGLAFGGVRKKP